MKGHVFVLFDAGKPFRKGSIEEFFYLPKVEVSKLECGSTRLYHEVDSQIVFEFVVRAKSDILDAKFVVD